MADARLGGPSRALEFYSGIGGMHHALRVAGLSEVKVVEAYDLNTTANVCYEAYFGLAPNPRNLETVVAADLPACDVWLLAPPCQPYTRQGRQRDMEDPRARSFLHLLDVMQTMGPEQLPAFLLLENVVGFEASATCQRLKQVLASLGYGMQQFLLTPKQFGVPYQRRRYFLLAKRAPLRFAHGAGDGPLLYAIPEGACRGSLDREAEPADLESHCLPLQAHLQLESDFPVDDFRVPEAVLATSGQASDIVTPACRSCCCFTKAYGRYLQGTGSVLQTSPGPPPTPPADPSAGPPDGPTLLADLRARRLRYFTPKEVAALHGFPPDFDFPAGVTVRQQYMLLGNSLSVTVVAELLRYLCHSPSPGPDEPVL